MPRYKIEQATSIDLQCETCSHTWTQKLPCHLNGKCPKCGAKTDLIKAAWFKVKPEGEGGQSAKGGRGRIDNEWKLTIKSVKEKDWPTIKKKLYFRCSQCGKMRDFHVEGTTIHVPKKCEDCGHNTVMVPTRISMGRGPWGQFLMLGIMLGISPANEYVVKEVTLELPE